MGRRSTLSIGDDYFDVSFRVREDGRQVKTSTCKYCHLVWDSVTSTRKCAHVGQVPGCGISICLAVVPPETLARIRPEFKEGLVFIAHMKMLADRKPQRPSSLDSVTGPDKQSAKQKTMHDMDVSLLIAEIDDLLGSAHHTQGNVADQFWENKDLRTALRKLAEAKPFHYEPPTRRKMGGERLDVECEKITKSITVIQSELETVTGSMDGWENILKLHWLARSIISRKGSFFKDAIDCTGVASMDGPWTLKHFTDFIAQEGGPSRMAAIVVDGPNVNRGSLKRMEVEEPTVFGLICICHAVSGFIKKVFKLSKVKATYQHVRDTGNKFRLVKHLRDSIMAVQATNEFKEHPNFKIPKIFKRESETRMAVKMDCTERAILLNPAAAAVMAAPTYQEKYEDTVVPDRGEDSDNEYTRRDRRSLSKVCLPSLLILFLILHSVLDFVLDSAFCS